MIPVLVFELTGSAAMSGLALAVEYAPKIVLVPFIGTWSQRFRLRPQFFFVEGTRASLCTILALAPHVNVVIAVAALIAISGSYAYLLNESLVAVAFSERDRTVVQARLQAADQFARIGGPALGAALYVYIGSRWLVVAAGASFVLCGLVLALLPQSADREPQARVRGPHGGVRRGLQIFLASPELIRLTSLLCATNFAGGVFLAIAPALIVEKFHLPLSHFGIAASVAAAVSAALMVFIGRRATTGSTTAVLGRRSLSAALVALIVICTAPNFTVFIAGYAMFTAANICFATYQRVERLRFIPSDTVGQTIGILTALFWLSVPLSGALVAVLVGPAGLRATMVLTSLTTAVCVLWLQQGLPKPRSVRAVA